MKLALSILDIKDSFLLGNVLRCETHKQLRLTPVKRGELFLFEDISFDQCCVWHLKVHTLFKKQSDGEIIVRWSNWKTHLASIKRPYHVA